MGEKFERLVIFTERESGPACGLDEGIIRQAGGRLRLMKARDYEERVRVTQPAEVLVAGLDAVPGEFLAALPRLTAVVRTGIGVDTVDIAAATDLGIIVANVPDFCHHEVAEHALALILSVARKIALADRYVRGGRWTRAMQAEMLPMRRLSGQTLAVIGLGRIGQSLARKAHGLGLRVIASDPYASVTAAQAAGVRVLPLEEVLPQADIISLHVPLTPTTQYLINPTTLAQMKPGAILVNTSRGGVVDEAALLAALASGRLGGAGLDVLEQEPPSGPHPLFQLDNVVFTCHYASCSEEAYGDLKRQISEQVAQVLRGEFPRNLVNPQVKKLPQCRLLRHGAGQAAEE